VPGTYADHLAGLRRLSGFPWLAREVPEVAALLQGGVFLSRRTLELDLAVASVLAAVASRRPVLALGALPWARRRTKTARGRQGRPVGIRLTQEAYADLVGLTALVRGSVRHRKLVL
jgi:hypothetical protein